MVVIIGGLKNDQRLVRCRFMSMMQLVTSCTCISRIVNPPLLTLRQRAIISNVEAANTYVPHFIADYNSRFAKPPRSNHNMHRPVRSDEDRRLIFAWREPRRVTQNLTIQYDKTLYLLADTSENRRLAGHYIDVYHYPDGLIEPRANGVALPFTIYDRLSEIDHGAIVDNKRLGHGLQMAQLVQER